MAAAALQLENGVWRVLEGDVERASPVGILIGENELIERDDKRRFRWKYTSVMDPEETAYGGAKELEELLAAGWEPFSVSQLNNSHSSHTFLHLRGLVEVK